MINIQQLGELQNKLFLCEFITDKRAFVFTKPLFFSMDNPLYDPVPAGWQPSDDEDAFFGISNQWQSYAMHQCCI